MSLLDVLRSGVKIANQVTKPLQSTVTYNRYLGDSGGYGEGSFGPGVPLRAIVDYKSRQVRTPQGVLTVSRAIITLLDVQAIIAATDGKGIDNNDRFTLQDGDTGPILDIGGFVDARTGNPVATEVMLG